MQKGPRGKGTIHPRGRIAVYMARRLDTMNTTPKRMSLWELPRFLQALLRRYVEEIVSSPPPSRENHESDTPNDAVTTGVSLCDSRFFLPEADLSTQELPTRSSGIVRFVVVANRSDGTARRD